jgi:putative hydrolase of the HAD superfamily
MPASDIKVLLFDLGGVLLRLNDPVATFGMQLTHAQFMERWLLSPSVREFERGAIDADTFAKNIVVEARLDYDPSEFLRRFDAWPDQLYPGTLELLEKIPRRYERAILSNTNAVHWQRVNHGDRLTPYFDKIFLSCETGLLKPDVQAFAHVAASSGCAAKNILFFDDNPLNVNAALDLGCAAELINGIDDLRRAFDQNGILSIE